jgi:hypothetical protein
LIKKKRRSVTAATLKNREIRAKMSEIKMAPGPQERVFDLINVIEEEDAMDRTGPLLGRTVYELVDVVSEEKPPHEAVIVTEDEIIKRVTAIAENVSRELFPAIAERIIREEIAKLKSEQGPGGKN